MIIAPTMRVIIPTMNKITPGIIPLRGFRLTWLLFPIIIGRYPNIPPTFTGLEPKLVIVSVYSPSTSGPNVVN